MLHALGCTEPDQDNHDAALIMKLAARIALFVSLLMLAAAAAAAVILPGPQHMVCPACYKLSRLAPDDPGIYVEAGTTNSERRRIATAVKLARREVAEFFGEMRSNPRIVVCRTYACAGRFGASGAKGIAYGWHAVLLAPSRVFEVIATHELVHIELHWRMGLIGWALGRVPAWFDEGLAVVVSNDPRLRQAVGRRAVEGVMQIESYLGAWAKYTEQVGWREAYGAAATRVRQIERRIGRDGLKSLVRRLVNEGNLAELMMRAEAGERI